jgi:hypothetical protein
VDVCHDGILVVAELGDGPLDDDGVRSQIHTKRIQFQHTFTSSDRGSLFSSSFSRFLFSFSVSFSILFSSLLLFFSSFLFFFSSFFSAFSIFFSYSFLLGVIAGSDGRSPVGISESGVSATGNIRYNVGSALEGAGYGAHVAKRM